MRPTQPAERLPVARTTGLSINAVGDEILVYDRNTDTAHCLGDTAALVWSACDGQLTIQELIDRESLDPDTVQVALRELNELGLFDSTPVRVQRSDRGISRRQAVGRLAAAAIGPLVVSVAAPAAWAATSTRPKSVCSGNPGTCPSGTVSCDTSCGPCTGNGAIGDPCSGTGTVCVTSINGTGNQCRINCCPINYACTNQNTCVRNF